jgi:TPR repeat protein
MKGGLKAERTRLSDRHGLLEGGMAADQCSRIECERWHFNGHKSRAGQGAGAARRSNKVVVVRGHAEAQTNLGNMYGNGESVQQNSDEATRRWQKAADRGD